jgi:hypothetical protein
MLHQEPVFVLPAKVEARWINPENIQGTKGAGGQADNGRKGAPCYGRIKAGAQLELANYQGTSGVIRHIWTTIDDRSPKMLRGLRMDVYWDGADRPAISAPWSDLFGFGLGRMAPFECAAFNSPEGRNFNCFLPMPFRSGFRMTVTNETDIDLAMFWFQADITINDDLPPNALYLHAYYHRENPTTELQDYEFLCPVKGAGRYLGANFGVIANSQLYYRSWWGEGEVKLYIDGDQRFPTLCGTGTEDYILTSWGQGRYANAYSGCHLAEHERFRYCFYRYHLPDPIYFRQEIRATIQQIGCWDPGTIAQFHGNGVQLMHGSQAVEMVAAAAASSYGLFERHDDWSSCAYFYLDSPTNDLPALDEVQLRTAGLD